MSQVAPSTARERIVGLEQSAEALVIVARQLGADEEAAVRALRAAWQRL